MARDPSPSGGTDALRRSLDRREVAAESEDRPYLVSMLRRLGYTDAQIQDYLAGRAEPGAPALPPLAAPAAESEADVEAAAPPAPAGHAKTEPDHGEERDVEVEYTGPGLQDYRLVDPVDFFGDDSALVEFQAEEAAPSEEAWDDGSETYKPGEGEELGSDGQPLAEFEPAAPAPEPSWEPETVPAEAPVDDAAEQAELAEIARRQGLTWEDAQAQPQDQAIHYGDYTLYQKDDLRDGQPARVFAFSKTPPGEGYEAATALPDGYHVAENPETGRPFLRRTGEEDWGLAESAGTGATGPQGGGDPSRRRVRLKRVRAANREEAMRQVEREGGSPLASVPIDIEKHLGDE
ncbi:MAG TPA: hypothetical protein VM241_02975 [Candidatus Thermoplasmatota archaeon]|nr:hypothetical protein [Candidatus Thermoplasmatota archaeon]